MALQEHRVVLAGQLEGDQPADPGLRRALLLHDPAVGYDAAGVELPARGLRPQQRGEALPPGLHWRGAMHRAEPPRHGSDAHRTGRRPHARQHGGGPLCRPPRPRFQSLQRCVPGRPGD